MSQKYHTASGSSTLSRQCSIQVITNDLFLAAFLYTVGCPLSRMERNDRRRVSFVFTGKRVVELREAYRTGPVHLDIRSFRENLNRLRDRLGSMVAQVHPEERSTARGSTKLTTSVHTKTFKRRAVGAYPHH